MTHPNSDNTELKRSRDGAGRKGRGRKHGPHGSRHPHGKRGPDGKRGLKRGPKSGRGPKRALRRGDLRYLILALIKDTPRHGYDMMSEIETLSKGAYKPSPGVIYPALELVQDMGWAKIELREDKKFYVITDIGKTVLGENEDRLTAIFARLADLSQPKREGETRPLRMALDGLRHDVKSYMRDNKPDETQREELATIITKARAEIAELAKRDSAKQDLAK